MNKVNPMTVVNTLKIISSPSKLRIIELLLGAKKELCVNEISEAVQLSHSATSHHLKRLEDKSVVHCFRRGQTICYLINKSALTRKLSNIINLFG